MIPLTKLKATDLTVMLAAVKHHYQAQKILLDTLSFDVHKLSVSILEELAEIIFDKTARSYKQKQFSLKLRRHQAILLVNALNRYCENTKNQHSKNTAIGLVLMIDPKL